MCKIVFKDFKPTFKQMWGLLYDRPNERIIGFTQDQREIVMRLDPNRALKGFRHEGDVAVPVIIEGIPLSGNHVLAFGKFDDDTDEQYLYLPCIKNAHLPWCDKHTRR